MYVCHAERRRRCAATRARPPSRAGRSPRPASLTSTRTPARGGTWRTCKYLLTNLTLLHLYKNLWHLSLTKNTSKSYFFYSLQICCINLSLLITFSFTLPFIVQFNFYFIYLRITCCVSIIFREHIASALHITKNQFKQYRQGRVCYV